MSAYPATIDRERDQSSRRKGGNNTMSLPIRRQVFWAASHPLPAVDEALKQAVEGVTAVAFESLGDTALPISIDHQVTVHGRSGDTAPSFLSTIFKDTPIKPSNTRYTVTATAVFEVFST